MDYYITGDFVPPVPVDVPVSRFIEETFSDHLGHAYDMAAWELVNKNQSNKNHVVHVVDGRIRSVDMRLIPTKYDDLFLWIAEQHVKARALSSDLVKKVLDLYKYRK